MMGGGGGSQKFTSSGSSHVVMVRLHSHWLTVCDRQHGDTRQKLLQFATDTVGRMERLQHSGVSVARIVAGFAWVRAGQYSTGIESFQEAVKSLEALPPADGHHTAATVALLWHAVALGASGRVVEMAELLERAEQTIASITGPAESLVGLSRLVQAFEQYHVGNPETALEFLEEIRGAFYGPGSNVLDFLGFQAEVCLLKAKLLRELAQYDKALAAVDEALVHRHRMNDPLGESMVCLESARIYRFQGAVERAKTQLRMADALLKQGSFCDWQCRTLDQWGDVYRAAGNLREATRCYEQAQRYASSSKCGHVLLRAHIDNSLARLHEEKGEYEKAIDLLTAHADTWKNTRAYGKYLYLLGSIYVLARDFHQSRRLLEMAVDRLRETRMPSYVALALNRLASLNLEEAEIVTAQGDSNESEHLRREACRYWSEAIRTAESSVDAEAFVERLRENLHRLDPVHLVRIISDLQRDLSGLKRVTAKEESRVAIRHQTEQKNIGHFYVRTANRFLFGREKTHRSPPVFLEQFARVLDSLEWWTSDFSRAPATPSSVDVVRLVSTCCEDVSRNTKRKLHVKCASQHMLIDVNMGLLRLAFHSLFEGLRAAFGVTQMSFLPREQEKGLVLEFRIEKPRVAPISDKFGQLLVCNEAIWNQPPKKSFERALYNGHVLVSHFILNTMLWLELEAQDHPNRVIIFSAQGNNHERINAVRSQ